MDKKRERERNWTWEEKEILKDALAPYVAVVDSKINNTNMIAKKNEAWNKEGRLKTNGRSNISAYKGPKEPHGLEYATQEITPIDFEEDSADFDSGAYLGAIAVTTDASEENVAEVKFRGVEEINQPPSIKRQKISLSEQMFQKRINQIDLEVSHEAELFDLKKKVQLRKLKLINIKIEKEEQLQ